MTKILDAEVCVEETEEAFNAVETWKVWWW